MIDQADIDQKQARTTGEIFEDVPGVTMIGSERLLGESFNIRGIGTTETSGDEARIIITVDGAKKFYEQYRMGSFFSDPELYKQVEVLRGPASSTLYGSGAIGGVINFTTKDASDFIRDGQTGALRVKGSYSSNGNGTLVSAILAHRINETFEVLATGNFRRSDLHAIWPAAAPCPARNSRPGRALSRAPSISMPSRWFACPTSAGTATPGRAGLCPDRHDPAEQSAEFRPDRPHRGRSDRRAEL